MPAMTCSQRRIDPAHSVSTTCKALDSLHLPRHSYHAKDAAARSNKPQAYAAFAYRLFGLADDPFDIPVEAAHLVATPGLAGRDAYCPGIVGDRSGEWIETILDFFG